LTNDKKNTKNLQNINENIKEKLLESKIREFCFYGDALLWCAICLVEIE
jgi:hypothetical protein